MKKLTILLFILLAGCGTGSGPVNEPAAPPDTPAPISQTDAMPPAAEAEEAEAEEIKINWGGDIVTTIRADQLGYRVNDKKRAALVTDGTDFDISRVSDGVVVYSGVLSEPVKSVAADEDVRLADFSDVTEPGEYFIATGDGRSYPFVINDKPYGTLRAALLEMFNYQKCGVDLECGIWSHPACHTAPAVIYGTEETKDVTGGWHDAGDYGRYIVPAAKSVADLLLAYEMAPNPDTDVLDITWYKIEWMLKMQDEATGGVYHKVSCKGFCGLDVMPQDERGGLVLSPISAAATADFAASMALASRFYPDKREALISAAKAAWDYCEANPTMPGFKNPQGVSTGEYGDGNSKDERFWAACELFIATGDESYHDYIKNGNLFSGLGWGDMGFYGLSAYLFNTGEKADDALYTRMKNKLIASCEEIMKNYNANPYGDSLGTNFPWGSNMNVANNAVTLLFGSRLADKPEYTEAALDHMHYLLGFNSLSQSFITGYGHNPPLNPHHRPSVAMGSAVPGMVVGGPENNLSDPALKSFRNGYPVAKRYIDDKESYASNEITIYWNSPAYLAVAILDL